jgi:hypothetical protein
MARTGLFFLLLDLNLSVVEVAGVVLLALMTRLLPAEMAVTVEPVMVVLELPCRPVQQMVLMEPAAVAEEVLDRGILSAPASISQAAKVARVAMDMWRFTQEVFLDENSLFK